MIEHHCIEDLGNIHIVYDDDGGWILKNEFTGAHPILSGISYCPYCGGFLDEEMQDEDLPPEKERTDESTG